MSKNSLYSFGDEQAGGGKSSSNAKRYSHPNPWCDYASSSLPQNMSDVLRWAEYVWLTNGTYRQACTRIARYFVTKLVFTEAETEDQENLQDIFEKNYRIYDKAAMIGDNYMAYGNLMATAPIPFERYLIDSDTGLMVTLKIALKHGLCKWNPEDATFMKTDSAMRLLRGQGGAAGQKANKNTPWRVKDDHSKDAGQLRVNLMNPHDMRIRYDEYSGKRQFRWKMDGEYCKRIKEGDPLLLECVPMEILETGVTKERLFQFDEDSLFYHHEPAPAGMKSGGWGIPRVISNFRQVWHHQVLNLYDQAVALDYINGMRVISPEKTNGGAADPIKNLGGSQFNTVVNAMIKEHRQDPASWHVSGFPLRYQLFGAEGAAISPYELMQAKTDELLDATGIPAEMFHGSLSVQAAPMALRLFEKSNPELTSLYQNYLSWVSSTMQRVCNVQPFEASWRPVTLIDDMENKGMMFQAMAGNQISPQTGLSVMGIESYRDEVRKRLEADRILAEEEREFQEEMAKDDEAAQLAMQMGGAVDPAMAEQGGAPLDPAVMGGPTAGATPESRTQEAERLAQEIMVMEATARRSQLIQLKKTDPTLHALVSQKIEDMEQQAGTAGVAAARQGQM